MSKATQKTIKVGKREIPLKNDGTPNLRHLGKEEKVAVKSYLEKVKKGRKEVELKQLVEVLKEIVPA